MLSDIYLIYKNLSGKELPDFNKLSDKNKDNFAMILEAFKIFYTKNPFKSKAIVYDIELANDPKLIGGWESYDRMEISCIATYDYETNVYRIWQHNEIEECIKFLESSKIIIGFNNINFDDKVMKSKGMKFDALLCVDVLRELWKSANLDPENSQPITHGGFSLDRVSTLTFGMKKTGKGAYAMQLFEEGKIGELYSYCLNDVRLTKKLMDRIVRGEPINAGNPSRVLFPLFDSSILADAQQTSLL